MTKYKLGDVVKIKRTCSRRIVGTAIVIKDCRDKIKLCSIEPNPGEETILYYKRGVWRELFKFFGEEFLMEGEYRLVK